VNGKLGRRATAVFCKSRGLTYSDGMIDRMSSWRVLLCGAVLAPASMATGACVAQDGIVDVELVLAVDVSLSMSPMELEIQRAGYAAALTDQQVINAILDGAHGRIAITYFEWAGEAVQKVVVPWTVIASRQDAERVAESLSADPPTSARRTSISGALGFAADLFAESGLRGQKRVIDISGDGPNNNGPPVELVRDAVLAQGITINGLPLMTSGGFSSVYDIDELDLYYTNCVIGGPGAFMIPVNDWPQFPEAVRRKLVLELAGGRSPEMAMEPAAQPPLVKAQTDAGVDCMIGETMWNSRSWTDPN
jgi:hypothetical protein